MENVLQFLADLAENNNREWFQQNKKRYDACREKILFLTDVLINEIRKFDPSIPVVSPADCMFRIFRDVRFSNDKRPYKTNFGSFIARGGRKSTFAGYYFHIEPCGCFAGGGIYMPDADTLKSLRGYIAENGDEFSAIINAPVFKKTFPEMYDDKLKTAPKGYDPNHEYIELLKYKSFAFTRKIDDEIVTGDKYVSALVESFGVLSKANAFLNLALEK